MSLSLATSCVTSARVASPIFSASILGLLFGVQGRRGGLELVLEVVLVGHDAFELFAVCHLGVGGRNGKGDLGDGVVGDGGQDWTFGVQQREAQVERPFFWSHGLPKLDDDVSRPVGGVGGEAATGDGVSALQLFDILVTLVCPVLQAQRCPLDGGAQLS